MAFQREQHIRNTFVTFESEGHRADESLFGQAQFVGIWRLISELVSFLKAR